MNDKIFKNKKNKKNKFEIIIFYYFSNIISNILLSLSKVV